MKTASNYQFGTSQSLKKEQYFRTIDENGTIHVRFPGMDSKYQTLTPASAYQMAAGQLPDLWEVCQAIETRYRELNAPFSAIDFLPVLEQLEPLAGEQAGIFLKNRDTRHVLITNDRMEVVLIHWKPGKASDVHGHGGKGCLFKLLKGKLEELRYTPESSPKLMGFNSYRSGDIAYIDDHTAYHQVGNPYGSSAITLHIYLK